MRSVARRQQLELATIRITLPVEDEQSIVDEIIEQLTPATRLLLLDHITSPTAIRLPVAAITARAEAMGTRVLIDGAHAPGQLELDLEQIGASWYVGNAHKWLAAAKGSALLHVAAQRQGEIEPLTISHGSDHHIAGYTPFEDAFAWTGTRDPAPWLAIPAALATLDSLHPSGLTAVRAINNLRAGELRQALLGFDGTVPVAPPCLHDHMVAIDLTGWLPQPLSGAELADTAAAVKDWLYRKHRIQIPLIAWQSRLLLRASVHFHVRDSDLERLVAAMPGLREQLQQSRSLSHTG